MEARVIASISATFRAGGEPVRVIGKSLVLASKSRFPFGAPIEDGELEGLKIKPRLHEGESAVKVRVAGIAAILLNPIMAATERGDGQKSGQAAEQSFYIDTISPLYLERIDNPEQSSLFHIHRSQVSFEATTELQVNAGSRERVMTIAVHAHMDGEERINCKISLSHASPKVVGALYELRDLSGGSAISGLIEMNSGQIPGLVVGEQNGLSVAYNNALLRVIFVTEF